MRSASFLFSSSFLFLAVFLPLRSFAGGMDSAVIIQVPNDNRIAQNYTPYHVVNGRETHLKFTANEIRFQHQDELGQMFSAIFRLPVGQSFQSGQEYIGDRLAPDDQPYWNLSALQGGDENCDGLATLTVHEIQPPTGNNTGLIAADLRAVCADSGEEMILSFRYNTNVPVAGNHGRVYAIVPTLVLPGRDFTVTLFPDEAAIGKTITLDNQRAGGLIDSITAEPDNTVTMTAPQTGSARMLLMLDPVVSGLENTIMDAIPIAVAGQDDYVTVLSFPSGSGSEYFEDADTFTWIEAYWNWAIDYSAHHGVILVSLRMTDDGEGKPHAGSDIEWVKVNNTGRICLDPVSSGTLNEFIINEDIQIDGAIVKRQQADLNFSISCSNFTLPIAGRLLIGYPVSEILVRNLQP